ncbi:MAG: hypothetical protein H6835_13705 [Planctomycetes bacterium]|nr:hypothetical protein [Planctomycetota bacterium]
MLVTGGLAAFDLTNPLATLTGILGSTELFDPTTGAFTAGPTLLEPRAFHSSTTTSDGQVLIAGGLTLLPIVNLPNVSSTAYKYNPASGSFSLPAFFTGARFLHSACALSDGKVLLAGGLSLDLTAFLTSGNIADIIIGNRQDCVLYSTGLFGLGTFTTVNGMQVGRAAAGMAALPNGGALIAGGLQITIDATTQTFAFGTTETADVFTQGPNTIAPTGAMAEPRAFPVMLPLSDGTILTVGGGPATAELYQR